MDISKVDKNFAVNGVTEQDVEWFDISAAPFSIHGVFYDENRQSYWRMPKTTADTVSEGVAWLAQFTAGGRVRFATDSPYVAVKAVLPTCIGIMPHMPFVASHSFSLYVDKRFEGIYSANVHEFVRAEKEGAFAFSAIRYKKPALHDCDVYFPLYGGVNKLYIGLKKGSALQPATPYTYTKPVVFYGSSITQGGCASHTGNDYVSLVSRILDTEFINLGFSGSAKGETQIAKYLASLDASVFVLDYDYNANNAEMLQKTHYPLYETVRKQNPNTPIIFMSKPDFDYDTASDCRRSIILQTVARAKAAGDENVWFIDGQTLWGKDERDACAVDTCHPNDLGFYRMAKAVQPLLKEALEKTK